MLFIMKPKNALDNIKDAIVKIRVKSETGTISP